MLFSLVLTALTAICILVTMYFCCNVYYGSAVSDVFQYNFYGLNYSNANHIYHKSICTALAIYFSAPPHTSMVRDINQMAVEGKLQAPHCTEHSLGDYRTGIVKAMEPFIGSKQVLVLNS